MKPPYCVRANGNMGHSYGIVVHETKSLIVVLMNKVVYVRLVYDTPKAFWKLYQPAEGQNPKRAAQTMVLTALTNGCAPAAMTHLEQLAVVPKAKIGTALRKGLETMATHKKEGAKMKAADEKAGKAPRKLSKAEQEAKRREELEAKDAERAYAQHIQEAEDMARKASKKAASKPTTRKVTRSSQKAADEKPKTTKKTAPRKTAAKKAPAKKPAAKKTPAKTKASGKTKLNGFDTNKLTKADGSWRSASSMFQGLLIEGKKSDDDIFAEVQAEFDLDDSKRSYVNWNRNHLRKLGVELGDPK